MGNLRHSVLDVIETALGERGDRVDWSKMSPGEVENLRDRLLEFSEADADVLVPAGTHLLSGTFSRYWEDPIFRGELSEALLYYPQLLVLDPFADFFADVSVLPAMREIRYLDRGRETMRVSAGGALWAAADSAERLGEDWDGIKARLSGISRRLYELEVPIRAGVIVLRNQWVVLRRQRSSLEASVRFDVRSEQMQSTVRALHEEGETLPLWDQLRGFHVTGTRHVHPSDAAWEFQHYFFHLAKSLAIANSAQATYAPSWPGDLKLLAAKVNAVPDRGYPPQVLSQISKILIPTADIPIREAVSIRSSSQDFDDWRAALRAFAREASSDSPAELAQRAEDTFRPTVRRLERELSGRKRRAARNVTTDFLLYGTISTAAASVAAADPISGAAIGAAAAGASGVVQWIRDAYRKPEIRGADAVMTVLLRPNRK